MGLNAQDVNLTDDEFATVQRALNFVRVAELENTPGCVVILPMFEGFNDRGVKVKMETFLSGTDSMCEEMLVALVCAMIRQGQFESIARALDRVASMSKFVKEMEALVNGAE